MVKICIKDGKYIVDATIHTEISTSNIAEVQESCAVEFAEAIRKMVINNEMLVNVMKKQVRSACYEND